MPRYHCSAILLLTLTVPPLALTACGAATSRATTRATSDDATITTRVKTALLNDPEIRSTIDVNTFDGVVTLSGAVRSPEERDKALALARKINGVSEVKSTLQIQ
jgi:hyperosmotically inducible protein